ncbi:MAG TPA: DUF488 domain-containing protein [Chloroflexota bacterium]|nr:DUF488 domain-containing protein [Chloroflexota bacterium]
MSPFLTLGHATRPIDDFLALLRDHDVKAVADVRTVPRSRANPQFSREALEASLRGAGIRYVHFPTLGGLRRPRPDSPNAGWRNSSFRGYADHMQTEEFSRGLQELLSLSAETQSAGGRVALVCAEMVPWRCHRSLVADALLVRGHAVDELIGDSRLRPHTLTPFARVDGERITYPPPDPAIEDTATRDIPTEHTTTEPPR